MAVYAVERRARIVERAREDGRVGVAALGAELDVATETVRRDLAELERQGLLHRVHGGAVPIEGVGFEGRLDRRASVNRDAKIRIGAVARELIGHADSVYVDEGSTPELVATGLRPQRPLTVVTCSLHVAAAIADTPDVTVVVLGGVLRPKTLATREHWAVRMLADLVIDVAILGSNGLSVQHGATCPDASAAAVKVAAFGAARRRVLIADSTKLGVDSFCRFAAVEDFDAVVTDDHADADQVRALRKAGADVRLA